MIVSEIRCRTILNKTGGFLGGYTHSINPYHGCSLGGTMCGLPDYAPEIVKGYGEERAWGSYLDVKVNAPEAYVADYDRIRKRAKPALRLFMASVTDPYVPQERTFRVTRRILEAMTDRPPDLLVLQTHTPNPVWDIDLLADLSRRFPLSVQVSVETDRESFPAPIRPHAYSIARRIEALSELTGRGIETTAVVAPMWPIADPEGFARMLAAACRYVVLDHFLLGDGTPGGSRTCGRLSLPGMTFPDLLASAGFSEWATLAPFARVRATFERVLGKERVGVSRDGFLWAGQRLLSSARTP